MSFRDIPSCIADNIKALFNLDYTPALAYTEFVKRLQTECQSSIEFQERLADRSILPSRRDFNNFYNSFKTEEFGSKDLKSMFATLKENIEILKRSDNDYTFLLNEFSDEENDPLVLVIITPLMKRVHRMVGIYI